MNGEDLTPSLDIDNYLALIETLAKEVRQVDIHDRISVFGIQEALIAQQHALQVTIKDIRDSAKTLPALKANTVDEKRAGWKEHVREIDAINAMLHSLASVHDTLFRMSRMVGSALAWRLLHGDERLIFPLADHSRVNRVSQGDGITGVRAAAWFIVNEHIGVPIVHDVTDVLRVGDITIVSANETPLTIEVKTNRRTDQSESTYLRVTLHGPEELGVLEVHEEGDELSVNVSPEPERRGEIEARLRNQLGRMDAVRQRQRAQSNQVFTVDDGLNFQAQHDLTDDDHHWSVLEQIASQARKIGYASRVVDDAMLYAAMYVKQPNGIHGSEDRVEQFNANFSRDLANSGVFKGDLDRDFAVCASTFDHFAGRGLASIRPMLCFPVAEETAIDLSTGRLIVKMCVNLGRVVEALQSAGIPARYPVSNDEVERLWIPITLEPAMTDRTAALEEFPIHHYGDRLLYEFITLDSFVRIVGQLVKRLRSLTAELLDLVDLDGDAPVS